MELPSLFGKSSLPATMRAILLEFFVSGEKGEELAASLFAVSEDSLH